MTIAQRHGDDHGGLVASDGRPLHNRYRILGPGQKALDVLTEQDGNCPWANEGRPWLRPPIGRSALK